MDRPVEIKLKGQLGRRLDESVLAGPESAEPDGDRCIVLFDSLTSTFYHKLDLSLYHK